MLRLLSAYRPIQVQDRLDEANLKTGDWNDLICKVQDIVNMMQRDILI